ncbi:MAG TPA: SagB/ThcOx family dehydrogenase [Longimicrobiales bacterium]|nr:SagB/ThcOx family dehydrogenase [Longimicrobiales bacterium]
MRKTTERSADAVELDRVSLPGPGDGGVTLAAALRGRRSVRAFLPESLELGQVADLLWAAQGATHGDGMRAAPSAGKLYPLRTYLVAGVVRGLAPGIYGYDSAAHVLEPVMEGDVREELGRVAQNQDWLAAASVVVVFTADYREPMRKYGERAVHYVDLEVGHAVENVCLQAVALGLGSTVVGRFHDDEVRRLLRASELERPLCLVPVGVPADA